MGLTHRIVRLCCFLAICMPLCAQVDRFVVSQVSPQLPVMRGYVDVVDATGQPVDGLSPADFTATLGTEPMKVTSVKRLLDSGEGVAYVFLVDISKSISRADFSSMQNSLQKWIANLRPSDRVAVCTFGDGYNLVSKFQSDKQSLSQSLAALTPRDMSTHLYEAITRVIDFQQHEGTDLPGRRVVVLLSDGKDEGSTVTSEQVIQQLQTSDTPVYVIGYSRVIGSHRHYYLDMLRRFAVVSGGAYEEASGRNFDQVYGRLQNAIIRVFVIDVSCAKCVGDGKAYPLVITLSRGAKPMRSSIRVIPIAAQVAPAPPRPADRPSTNSMTIWLSLAVLVIAGLAVMLLRKKRPKPASEGATPLQPTSPPINNPPGQQPSETGVPVRLAVVAGKERGRVYDLRLTKPLVIGRDKRCDLVLEDPRVSERHCEVALSNNSIMLYDLDSKNRTYVNGVPIRDRQKLETEDCLLLGETELRLHFNADEVLSR